MNETILLWLFGIIAASLAALSSAVFLQAQRLTKLETIFNFWIETIGKKAAQILHSPGDHLGLDKYLDKFLKDHPALVYEDWIEIKLMCEKVENDPTVESSKRLIAGFVAAGAIQKMMLMNKNVSSVSELRNNPSNGKGL